MILLALLVMTVWCFLQHRTWQLWPLSQPLLTWPPLLRAAVTVQDVVCGTPHTTIVTISALLVAQLTRIAASVQTLLAWLPCALLHCLVNVATNPSSWAAAVFVVISPREWPCRCPFLALPPWSMHVVSDGQPRRAASTAAACPVLEAVLLSGAATSSRHRPSDDWMSPWCVCPPPVLRSYSPHVAVPGCAADRRQVTCLIRLAQCRLLLQDISHDTLGEHAGGC